MLRAMSTQVYVKERLHPGHLDRMAQGGAEAIELFGARGHFDYSSRQHVQEIVGWFKSNSIVFHSMHSPMYLFPEVGQQGPAANICDLDKKGRIAAMDEIKRAIEVAEQLPFRFLVQHLGVSGESFSGHKFDNAMTSVEHLRAFAKPLGVRILLENIPNELSTAEKLVEFIQTTHFDDVGVCFDLGHAHIMARVDSEFETLKPHIRSTHVHDNGGQKDDHLWPGEGTIDWKSAIEMLQSAPHMPPCLLEVKNGEQVAVPEKTAEAFKKFGV